MPIDERTHRAWLESALRDKNIKLFIAEQSQTPVGTVRLDFGADCEVSWTVAPAARGMGIGRRMVWQVVRHVKQPMRAVAKTSNIASQRIAYAAGFDLVEFDEDWLIFRRNASISEREDG